MTPKIIVYHSVLGIRQGEKNLAERMRKLGFEVIVQDLYEGKVFDDYESGLALFEEMGVMGLVAQAQKGLEGMEGPVIFSGFSNGGGRDSTVSANGRLPSLPCRASGRRNRGC